MSDIITLIASYWWLWIVIAAVNSIIAMILMLKKQASIFSAMFSFDFSNIFGSFLSMMKGMRVFAVFAAVDTICGALLLISVLHFVIAFVS